MRSHVKPLSAGLEKRRRPSRLLVMLATAVFAALAIGVSLANATAPTVTIENAGEVGFNSAKATGHVDPADKETYYHFEYATQAQFTNSEWAEASQTDHTSLPENAGNTEVSATLGLATGTTYHLRLVATNEDGEDNAVAASTFTTEAVNLPEVEIDSASSVDVYSAHLSGTVNSGGSNPGEATEYAFSCSPSCQGLDDFQPITSDGTDQSVQADAEGLLPNTEYTITLTARNAAGEASDQTTFTTDAIGPQANTAFVAPRDTDSARLNAYIVPNNSETTYYFQYGPSDCSANPCTSVPLTEDATVSPTDMESHLVSQELEGLSESTTYHYRVVAESAAGTASGVDKTFETRSAAEMVLAPRGYELVNDPNKGNQNIEGVWLGERGAHFVNTPDGEAAAWSVAGGAPGGTTTAKNPFLSRRGPNGWSTESMVGSAEEQYGEGNKNFKFISASPDLSSLILYAEEGVLTSPDTAIVRSDRDGAQEPLATFPGQVGGLYARVETSRDGRHVLYNDGFGDGSGRVYDYGSGIPEEVAVMADDSPPACGVSNFYSWPGYHWIATTDASRVFFEAQGDNCGDPAGVYVRNRETEDTTQLVAAGNFIRATPDGRAALFSTSLALSGEDSNSTRDIYRWSESLGTKCLTCSVPNAEVGDVATSEDLSRTYFTSPNELVQGERKGGGTYVVRADGSIHFAGRFQLQNGLGNGLTPDGSAAVFRTEERLTDDAVAAQCPTSIYQDGPHTCTEIYYYDEENGSIECLSCVPDGVTRQDAGFYGFEVSDDGDTVAFETPEQLLPSDVNGGSDIYQWHHGKLGLITDGVTKFPGGDPSGGPSFGAPTVRGVSANGRDIFFSLVAPLTGFELDGLSNLYDARIGGGFPPRTSPMHCDGDSCQGPLEVSPASVRSASSTFFGNGNAASGPQARCRGANVRRKGRCVSKRRKSQRACRRSQAKPRQRCAKDKANSKQKRSRRDDKGGAK